MKLKYQIRSVALVSIVNDIKQKRLIPNAYFQRNLVWRDIHKREFIDTILKGYPFPQIFISRGKIDIETMQSTSCIVDGQQRTNAITEYISGKFSVNGKKYHELNNEEKSELLKYEIGVVELDMDNDDPAIKEMFKRVNRTSNSLTAIEKIASEYGATEYMIAAKILADDIEFGSDENEDGLYIDPAIDDSLLVWARKKHPKNYIKILSEDEGIFTSRDINRKVPLMYTLNIMSTILIGFFRRNESSITLLDDYKDNFSDKDKIIDLIDLSASTFLKLKLPKTSIWRNKSNFFSLIVAIANSGGKINDAKSTRQRLIEFETNVPPEYSLAAKEAVNNKNERELRDRYVKNLLSLDR